MAVVPLGFILFGSTITRSERGSSADFSQTRKGCCFGGWNFKEKSVPARYRRSEQGSWRRQASLRLREAALVSSSGAPHECVGPLWQAEPHHSGGRAEGLAPFGRAADGGWDFVPPDRHEAEAREEVLGRGGQQENRAHASPPRLRHGIAREASPQPRSAVAFGDGERTKQRTVFVELDGDTPCDLIFPACEQDPRVPH